MAVVAQTVFGAPKASRAKRTLRGRGSWPLEVIGSASGQRAEARCPESEVRQKFVRRRKERVKIVNSDLRPNWFLRASSKAVCWPGEHLLNSDRLQRGVFFFVGVLFFSLPLPPFRSRRVARSLCSRVNEKRKRQNLFFPGLHGRRKKQTKKRWLSAPLAS